VSALGAVTAHLIHGLRNPVSGLQSFVATGSEPGGADPGAWEDARLATGRMQALIEQVVRVLREHESDLAYQVSPRELAEAVFQRVRRAADARGVALVLEGNPAGMVDNRRSGLLALILTNLVENGIDASGRGGTVALRLASTPDGLAIEVSDTGPGLGREARERLFQPQRSTKEGGSGLGLAITHQLALALGGRVGLLSTGSDGTVFRVDLPVDQSASGSSGA
jgi:signal transduction histidine kinase